MEPYGRPSGKVCPGAPAILVGKMIRPYRKRKSSLNPYSHGSRGSMCSAFSLADRSSGTDHRIGVSFDHKDGSAAGGSTGYDVFSAYAGAARHAAKNAESEPTRNMAWPSWARTGRPGVRVS
jgi:hypothetical protein